MSTTEHFEPTDPRLSFLSLDAATSPRTGTHDVYRDYWFIVHPERGIVVFRGFAVQCNANRAIVDSLAASLYPWAEVRQIALVCRPHRCDR